MCCECLGGIFCCCAGCCCNECTSSMQKMLGKQKMTKFCYLFIVVIFTIPAIVILFFINNWSGFQSYFSWMTCPASSGGNFNCIGPSTVYRISLAFLVLFFVMLVIMLFRSRISMIINEGCFFIKYLAVLVIFIGFLFIGSDPFNQYAQASKYISIIFMIIQSIILIDLFYLAGIKLVARYDRGQTGCAIVLVLLTLIFEAIAVGLNVYGYINFNSSDGCGNTLWVNIITSIILFILPFFQLCNFNKQNSLLTTALISMYISYLAFICQFSYSQSGDQCSERMTIKSIAADIIVSSFLYILTMYGTIMGGSGQIKVGQNGNVNEAMGVAPVQLQPTGQKLQIKQNHKSQPSQEQVETQQSNQAKYTQSWGWVKWHFYMCIASIYLGMLVTNWTSASLTTGVLVSNGFGFWVRVVISWATALLYIWTLIAPKICPERDFSVV